MKSVNIINKQYSAFGRKPWSNFFAGFMVIICIIGSLNSTNAVAATIYPSDSKSPDLVSLLSRMNDFWHSDGKNDLHGTVVGAEKSTLQHNDEMAVWINNNASERQKFQALQDANYQPYELVSNALGTRLGPLYLAGIKSGKLAKTRALMEDMLNYVTTDAAKQTFSYPRPYLQTNKESTEGPCLASRTNADSLRTIRAGTTYSDDKGNLRIVQVPNMKDTTGNHASSGTVLSANYSGFCNSGSFPSGHTTNAYLTDLMLATVLPEFAPEILARASEAANNRIVLGVHYPLDIIAGRMSGEAGVASRWADAQYRQNVIVPVRNELIEYLQTQCGGTLTQCSSKQDPYADDPYAGSVVPGGTNQQVSNRKTAANVYRERLKYGFTRNDSHTLPSVVPDAAADLLLSTFPTLTHEQRKSILEQTQIESGYPLDNGGASDGSWQRLDLASAMSSTIRLDKDGRATVIGTGGIPTVQAPNIKSSISVLSGTDVSSGGFVTVTGMGLSPSSVYHLLLGDNNPMDLGTVTATNEGSFMETVRIPDKSTNGSLRLRLVDSNSRDIPGASLTLNVISANSADSSATKAVVAKTIVLQRLGEYSKMRVMLKSVQQDSPAIGSALQQTVNLWSDLDSGSLKLSDPSKSVPTKEHVFVLLGYALNADGTMQNTMLERLRIAKKALDLNPNSKILVSGGAPRNGRTEAQTMRDWLISNGVSENRILVEDQSTDTPTNAINSINVLYGQKDLSSYTLISSASHLRRASILFRAASLIRAGNDGNRILSDTDPIAYFDVINAANPPSESETSLIAQNVAKVFSVENEYQMYQDGKWSDDAPSDETYILNDADDLQLLAQHPSATFKLNADIDFSHANWTPINTFSGTFDGQGHVISNLSVKGNASKAMFINSTGTILNLGINGLTSSLTGAYRQTTSVAGLVVNNNGVMKQVWLTNATISGAWQGGGLAANNYGVIQDSYVADSVIHANWETGAVSAISRSGSTLSRTYAVNVTATSDVSNAGFITGWTTPGATIQSNIIVSGSLTVPVTGIFGRVAGQEKNGAPAYVDNFSDISALINGKIVSSGTSSDKNGGSLASADLKRQSTFEKIGWNFTNVWVWNETLRRPVLRSMVDAKTPQVTVLHRSLIYKAGKAPNNAELIKAVGASTTFGELRIDVGKINFDKAGHYLMYVTASSNEGYVSDPIEITVTVFDGSINVDDSGLVPGGSFELAGQGFQADQLYRIVLRNQVTDLMQVRTDKHGKFSVKVLLPTTISLGRHQVDIVDDNGISQLHRPVSITVTSKKNPSTNTDHPSDDKRSYTPLANVNSDEHSSSMLPRTGVDMNTLLIWELGLVVCSGLLIATRLVRRNRER